VLVREVHHSDALAELVVTDSPLGHER
jgi:hypothetical protein